MLQPNEHQHHTIWTPELVDISLPLAGVARRCMAMLIDQIVIFVFLAGVGIGVLIYLGASLRYFGHSSDPMHYIAIGIGLSLFVILTYLLYFCALHTFNKGQTLGKKWVGIRLVTDRGGRVNVWTCCVRSLFDLLDFGLFYGGVSVIMILMTEREKRIADFAAGTLVILDK